MTCQNNEYILAQLQAALQKTNFLRPSKIPLNETTKVNCILTETSSGKSSSSDSKEYTKMSLDRISFILSLCPVQYYIVIPDRHLYSKHTLKDQ